VATGKFVLLGEAVFEDPEVQLFDGQSWLDVLDVRLGGDNREDVALADVFDALRECVQFRESLVVPTDEQGHLVHQEDNFDRAVVFRF
jgi:hypothetical protein